METKHIKEIKNTDAFDVFNWLGDDFKKYNLVYGWNGSGKTTISRIYNFLERKKIHIPDLSSIEFSIQTDGGLVKQNSLTTHTLNIRVFNEDFIKENLSLEQSQAKKIVILGKENVAIQQELEALNIDLTDKTNKVVALEEELNRLPKLEDILSEAGREVPKQFANTPLASGGYYGRSYDRRKVEKHIETGAIAEANLDKLIIQDQADIDSKRDTIKNEKKEIVLSVPDIADFSELFKSANDLLTATLSITNIEELQNDKPLRDWVETGYKLHKDKADKKCQFCKSVFSDELLTQLGSFFTDELQKAKDQIDTVLDDLTKDSLSGRGIDLMEASLFQQSTKDYTSVKKELEEQAEIIKSGLASLVGQLKLKKDNLHDHSKTYSSVPYPLEAVQKINTNIQKIRDIISDHNSRIGTLSAEVATIAGDLELHIIAQVLKNSNYFHNKKEDDRIRADIKVLLGEREALNTQIKAKKASLHNASDAIEKINSILKEFFGEDHISLEITETPSKEVQYVLKRRNKDAKHLSEGEVSVLALVYFLIKLEEDGCDKSNCIIVIDDPVDSQDSIFLFRTAGLIKRQLKDVGQLIILTHNFDFFNLIRDWYLTKQLGASSALFLISHNRTGTPHEVKVENLPDLLRVYKSEYQYLFCRLYRYANDIQQLDEPLVANISRKVLEYFAGFKWSCKTTEDFTNIVVSRFVGDADELKKGTGDFVVKFLHEYSHGQDFSRSISASMLESNDIAKNVLKFIELADKEHYTDLKAICDKAS